ncbi:MAG: diacylglycerol kinase family protein [Chloroflexi bacterium]|nr:diacylglycerol kinase family protein [Chloroflexota bacterium]
MPASSRLNSFKHAFAGWWHVLKTQPNAKIHALISVAVFIIGLWVELNRYEWALITIMAVIVWMGEFINTALEAIVDLTSPQIHPLAKIGKDVGAAAVLIAAIAAVIVGLLILGPPLLEKVIALIR